jgi:tetratricopeptide (TPR) repeat protein
MTETAERFMTTLLALLASAVLAASAQTPSGWDETSRRGAQLMLDGKTPEAIALFEQIVARAPDFEGGHYSLADAHRFLAIELKAKGDSQAAESRRHFEVAAEQYRWVAQRKGPYRQLAVGQLMSVYGESALNQPREAIPFARLYIEISPSSAIGHVSLARYLRAAGDTKGATAAFLAGRAAVTGDDDRTLLATGMIDHLASAPDVPAADVRALLDYAQPVLDAAIAASPDNRNHLLTKAAALKLRAERVERSAAARKALEAESDRIFERFRAMNPDRNDRASAATAAADTAPAEPPGFAAARESGDALVKRKEYAQAAAVYEKFIRSDPAFPPPHYLRLGALLAAGQSAVVDDALRAARAAIPATPESREMMATYLVDLEMRTPGLAATDAKKLLADAVAVLDEAIALKPQFLEALVYKAVALRRQARLETDPAKVKALTDEADRLRAQAQALRK